MRLVPDDNQICLLLNTMWSIWKARCAKLYGGQNMSAQKILAEAAALYSNAVYSGAEAFNRRGGS
jgi:hypothetical protein